MLILGFSPFNSYTGSRPQIKPYVSGSRLLPIQVREQSDTKGSKPKKNKIEISKGKKFFSQYASCNYKNFPSDCPLTYVSQISFPVILMS